MNNNSKLTDLGKMFFASAIGFIFGKKLNMKLRGTPEQVQAVSDALIASKRFQETLQRPGVTVRAVLDALNLKKEKAKAFSDKFKIEWPL